MAAFMEAGRVTEYDCSGSTSADLRLNRKYSVDCTVRRVVVSIDTLPVHLAETASSLSFRYITKRPIMLGNILQVHKHLHHPSVLGITMPSLASDVRASHRHIAPKRYVQQPGKHLKITGCNSEQFRTETELHETVVHIEHRRLTQQRYQVGLA